jgi:CheY-like chemotaxis protein
VERHDGEMSKNFKTVLVVDDLETLRKMLRDFLESVGIEVLEAAGAAEAIEIVRARPQAIDLLLTDLEMPEMSGWEVAKKIADLEPNICIIYMSGGISLQEWRHDQDRVAFSYFLHKPFGLKELKKLLLAILSE